MSFYRRYGKRLFDLVAAMAALIVLSPLLLAIAALVKLMHGSPVLFTQERAGRHDRIFRIYKFRTMTDERDQRGELLPDEQRLTRFGQLLRSTSLDELPELINIIRGELSVVGPRPLFVKYLPLYNDEQRRRHEVKPGLTGFAAVSGRNALGWQRRFKYDVYYVDHYNFFLDLRIIIDTLKKVMQREGINEAGHVTTSHFQGNGATHYWSRTPK